MDRSTRLATRLYIRIRLGDNQIEEISAGRDEVRQCLCLCNDVVVLVRPDFAPVSVLIATPLIW